tara:strand:- start:86165 stop:86878 length:714 start_codon:yes stop_codon:yes gene_type:complete
MNTIFDVRFDANDKLFQLKVSEDAHLLKDFPKDFPKDFLARLKEYALDKKLDVLLKDSFHDFSQTLTEQSLIHSFKISLHNFRGDTIIEETHQKDSSQLVCRCNLLYKSDLVQAFKDVRGKKVDFFQRTKASMICSECRKEVNEILESSEHEFYHGEKLSRYSQLIQEQLIEYFLFAPYSETQIQLSLDKLVPGKARIRVTRSDKSVKKADLHKSLLEFFPKDISQVFEISLVINDN